MVAVPRSSVLMIARIRISRATPRRRSVVSIAALARAAARAHGAARAQHNGDKGHKGKTILRLYVSAFDTKANQTGLYLGVLRVLCVEPSRLYVSFEIRSKIGMYIAMTMPPTMMPRKAIMTGSS